MTKEELLQLIILKEEPIDAGRPNRPGVIIKSSKITIHNTSNSNAGADAEMHSKFVRKTGYYITKNPQTGIEKKNWVSWHFTVDDKMAIKHLPINEKAYHAGSNANETSIAIEICMHKGIQQKDANERAAQLAALLCYELSIPLANVVTHNFWTGKNCPALLLKSWKAFLDEIDPYLKQLKAEGSSEFGSHVPGGALGTDETINIPFCWTDSADTSTEIDALEGETFLASAVQEGFNDKFLSSGRISLPVLTSQNNFVFIHHQNMSTYFNRDRKLALYTACNYDKDALFEKIGRSNAFRDDPSIDSSFQLGKGFYSSPTLDISSSQNYFDRGHLIARRYNQWGSTEEEARRGERDTYFHTTIHPQVKELNQDEWEELESFIIEHGQLDIRRVSIIAGSLLRPNDPLATYFDDDYKIDRTVQIPIVYWKVVFYEVSGQLRKIACLMSQRNRLKQIDFIQFEEISHLDDADPFNKIGDPLKTYIVKSSLIESEIGFNFAHAIELYRQEEPLEVVIKDNETLSGMFNVESNILEFI